MVTSTMKMLPNDTEFTDLEKRAHLDLAKRARGGTIIYLAVWLISAIWVGMTQTSPVFFFVNTFFFSCRRIHAHCALSAVDSAS